MKHIFFCFAFVMSAMFSLAQEDTLATAIKIKLPNSDFKAKALVSEIEISIVPTKDSIVIPKIDIKSDHWDITTYNPYKDAIVQYPLKLNFTDSTYTSPVSHNKVITSRYGWRRGRPHKGIDIDLVTGDSVVSILDGIVRFARYSSGHGKTIVVRHYNGLETTYAHLSHIEIKANDSIVKGQYIGKGGNTGNSRGSHLHLVASFKGEYIHPDYLFNFDSSNAIRSHELWVTRKWTRPSYHSSKGLAKILLYETKEAAIASLEKKHKVYVVKQGDTLSRISRRNDTSIASICHTNKIKKTSTLKIGQELVLEL